MSHHTNRLTVAIVAAAIAALADVAAQSPRDAGTPSARTPASAVAAQKTGSLDDLMARVLQHRDEAWKKLHDYVLSETERFDLTGPNGSRLNGMRRDFSWYVRDGYLIRSPIKFDGVTIPEAERRKYEDNWLQEEKARDARRAKRVAQSDAGQVNPAASDKSDPTLQDFVGPGREPRFVSEAFFLKFRFEAGNYYLAGRERLDGRDVVRVEYYPTDLFGGHRADRPERRPTSPKDAAMERRIEKDLNKVALVTLWIDPQEYQVVRYKFDNVDFGFLPARWLVRVDTITASMTMARVLDGVWLPSEMNVQAGITLATGSYAFTYGRQLYDYKKAETSAKIRGDGDVR